VRPDLLSGMIDLRRLAVLLLSLLLANVAFGDRAVVLSGLWTLDKHASDDVKGVLKRLFPRQGPRFGWRHEIQVGKDPDATRVRLAQLVLSDSDLRISQSGPEITFSYTGEYQRSFFTDGRGQSISATGGTQQAPIGFSFGTWIDGVLLVESRKENGIILYERYRLLEGANVLEQRIEVYLPAAGESTEIRRVFTHADPPPN
jgi:hypothetical protein